uniref:Uncharacterized protein n=1 Tax=viral metagenome TaxID=1070528 RepID=A0A6M3IQQ5_9ZZZZ
MNIKKTLYNRRLKKYNEFLYFRQWWINWGLSQSLARVRAWQQVFGYRLKREPITGEVKF